MDAEYDMDAEYPKPSEDDSYDTVCSGCRAACLCFFIALLALNAFVLHVLNASFFGEHLFVCLVWCGGLVAAL